jgi:hypothetical protein
MANRKVFDMLPTILAKSFEQSIWSSKDFSKEKIEGAIITLVPVGGGKRPPHTENDY